MEMERFGKSLKHQDEAICVVAAGGSYAKLPRIMTEEITFDDIDCAGTDYPHTDALVISTRIGLIKVHRILIDNGSSVSLLFKLLTKWGCQKRIYFLAQVPCKDF